MRTFSVKNFEKFQHYKDRSPPWIKLYNELLDDYEFGRLQDASKMHLIGIWLLASRSDNKIPYDSEWVQKRINANSMVNLEELEQAGFIVVSQELQSSEQPASTPLAKCLTREEGETEKRRGEKRENIARASRSDFDLFWEAYPRKVGKGAARKAFVKASKNTPPDGIIAALKVARFHDDPQFIPHPATWLNQERWADPPEAPPGPDPKADPIEAQWRARLKGYKPGGYWPDVWGNRPGEPGCVAPHALLREFGLDPNPRSPS
jgi:hypothetical protein